MRDLRLLLITPLLLIGLSSERALAYEVMTAPQTGNELRWTSLPMEINIDQGAAPGVSATETHNAIRAGYDSWQNVSCAYYTYTYLGLVNLPFGDKQDYVNTNAYPSSWPSNMPGNALGVTQTYFDPYGGKIIDADTLYNPGVQWSTTGGYYSHDVQSVATHEIGHQLGLDHSQYQDATMFYATGMGDTSPRSLSSDDIEGICYLYPTGTTPPPECTNPSQCGPDETCDNNKCVPLNQKGYGGTCVIAKDCISGLCLQYGDDNFCSQGCDTEPCPNGDQCLPVTGGGDITKACLPNSANQMTKELGEPCINSMDCKSNICVNVPGMGYLCSQQCDLNAQDCPSGYACVQSSIGGLCVPDEDEPPPPPPPDKKKLGETCQNHSDCESELCIGGATGSICSQWCDLEKDDCPDGYICKSAGNDKGACDVDTSQQQPPPAGALGATCESHDDCDSGMCASDSEGNKFCTELCDPNQGCATGYDCVSAGGGKNVCSPSTNNANANADDGESDGGCALSSGPSRAGGPLVLLGFLLVVLLLRRRRVT